MSKKVFKKQFVVNDETAGMLFFDTLEEAFDEFKNDNINTLEIATYIVKEE